LAQWSKNPLKGLKKRCALNYPLSCLKRPTKTLAGR
jgi:hypothetical protein